jgi:L-threonylcarbamoyladenylate synthase
VGELTAATTAAVPRVPGSSQAHYAPSTPLRLVADGQIERLAAELSRGGTRIGVLAQRSPLGSFRHVTWVNAGTRLDGYAHDLYANLRTLDKAGASCLLVQEVPGDERWEAVRDRLTRAAAATAPELGDLP